MSKKYVIELDDRIKLVTSVGVTENGVVYTTSDYVHNLEELNSDYINEHYGELQDEAYQRGINDGSLDVKQRVEGAYQRGLEDAWEAARKISHASQMKMKEMGFDFTGKDWCYNPSWYVVMNYTASEAIEKLKAYEDKQKDDDHIKVGDEVESPRGKAVVTAVKDDLVHYFYSDGDCRFTEQENLKKTGKHYDIQSILREMQND